MGALTHVLLRGDWRTSSPRVGWATVCISIPTHIWFIASQDHGWRPSGTWLCVVRGVLVPRDRDMA